MLKYIRDEMSCMCGVVGRKRTYGKMLTLQSRWMVYVAIHCTSLSTFSGCLTFFNIYKNEKKQT